MNSGKIGVWCNWPIVTAGFHCPNIWDTLYFYYTVLTSRYTDFVKLDTVLNSHIPQDTLFWDTLNIFGTLISVPWGLAVIVFRYKLSSCIVSNWYCNSRFSFLAKFNLSFSSSLWCLWKMIFWSCCNNSILLQTVMSLELSFSKNNLF